MTVSSRWPEGVLEAVGVLLTRTIGVSVDVLGWAHIEAAVEARTTPCRAGSWLARLPGDAAELQALIDEVVVGETWLFRDPQVFSSLTSYAGGFSRPLRILCAPCGTGEEAWSIAVAVLQAGCSCRIDAVDIRERSLSVARAGRYGPRSLRADGLAGREAWFRAADGGGVEIAPTVRSMVRFAQGNLLDPVSGPYDVIFCRNLLIYLEPAARRRVVANLGAALADGGRIHVGSVERLEGMDATFRRVGPARAFAYERTSPPAAPIVRQTERGPVAPPDPQEKLLAAWRFADSGHIDRAAELGEQILARRPNHGAYVLLGVVSIARGDRKASENYFRAAVALAPHDVESLTYLALLKEASGDAVSAAAYRQEAARDRR